jgi:uncharacterized RDD family membrane protein YckC
MIPRAGFVSRMGAFAADAIIMTLAMRGTVWILQAAGHVLRRFAPPVNVASLLLAIGPLLTAIYLVAFWTLLGQTPGKILFGLKIVTQGDAPVGFRRSLVRLVGYVVSALPCYLGFLWILGPQRRAWHDRLAGTEVVYVARRPRAVEHEKPAAPTLRALAPQSD